MSENEQNVRPKLRWWFWLVLFAPTLAAIGSPLASLSVAENIAVFALLLNFICSRWAGKQIVLLRDSRGGSSSWMFLWWPLLFFLNFFLSLAGCASLNKGAV
jgi:hypothetical protein